MDNHQWNAFSTSSSTSHSYWCMSNPKEKEKKKRAIQSFVRSYFRRVIGPHMVGNINATHII
jgi:hypothetical protein